MNDVTMSLQDDGTVLHDYGPGSCFSCGGTVHATHDDQRGEIARCIQCGPVVDVVFHSDTGDPLQGFMSFADVAALPVLRDDPGAEWLF